MLMYVPIVEKLNLQKMFIVKSIVLNVMVRELLNIVV